MKNKNTGLWIIVALAVGLGLGFFGFAGFGGYGTMGMMNGGYGSGMMFFGWITWLLVVILVVAGIYWLVKSANKK